MARELVAVFGRVLRARHTASGPVRSVPLPPFCPMVFIRLRADATSNRGWPPIAEFIHSTSRATDAPTLALIGPPSAHS